MADLPFDFAHNSSLKVLDLCKTFGLLYQLLRVMNDTPNSRMTDQIDGSPCNHGLMYLLMSSASDGCTRASKTNTKSEVIIRLLRWRVIWIVIISLVALVRIRFVFLVAFAAAYTRLMNFLFCRFTYPHIVPFIRPGIVYLVPRSHALCLSVPNDTFKIRGLVPSHTQDRHSILLCLIGLGSRVKPVSWKLHPLETCSFSGILDLSLMLQDSIKCNNGSSNLFPCLILHLSYFF
jgi:uncharacterized integral membrane protein